MSIYDFIVQDSNGNDIAMKEYKGKVLLIVNTATECGYTPQLGGLQNLYTKYRGKGLEILAFPCNQFQGQAPGSDREIASFCSMRYGTTFMQFRKIDVNGPNELPLYRYLKDRAGETPGEDIRWNFNKFLVDREGNVLARYGKAVTPEVLEVEIVKLL